MSLGHQLFLTIRSLPQWPELFHSHEQRLNGLVQVIQIPSSNQRLCSTLRCSSRKNATDLKQCGMTTKQPSTTSILA